LRKLTRFDRVHRTSPQSALGGQTITTTVESRERFPVRLRYARDFRLDEESIKQLLVSGSAGQSAADSERDLTTMIGLVPMLWATGTGSEIMRPMAAPVLGGILASDEVVDMLLPVLFYHVRKCAGGEFIGAAQRRPKRCPRVSSNTRASV
jgi:Cu/Ag efflux pump CusA